MNDDLRYTLKNAQEYISDEFGNGQDEEGIEKLREEILAGLDVLRLHTESLYDAELLEIEREDDGLDVDDFEYELSQNK